MDVGILDAAFRPNLNRSTDEAAIRMRMRSNYPVNALELGKSDLSTP